MQNLKERLNLNATVMDYAQSVVNKLKFDAKKFVLFGAGITGTNVFRYLKKMG